MIRKARIYREVKAEGCNCLLLISTRQCQ